jgi:hypothetical protein
MSLRDNLDLATPMGRFTAQLIGAMADFEKELIRERVQAGLERRKNELQKRGWFTSKSHAANENDNQEMRTVLRQLSLIQSKIGCGIGVVHHYNKAGEGSMTQRLRGSSAIAGWAEWLIGISMADEETRTRRMEFELKAAEPPEPIHFRIESSPEVSRLERVSYDSQHRATREGSAAARLMQ